MGDTYNQENNPGSGQGKPESPSECSKCDTSKQEKNAESQKPGDRDASSDDETTGSVERDEVSSLVERLANTGLSPRSAAEPANPTQHPTSSSSQNQSENSSPGPNSFQTVPKYHRLMAAHIREILDELERASG